MQIHFELINSSALTFTSYGHVTVSHDGEQWSTKDASNNQSKMILPSIIELMDGLVKLYTQKIEAFEFVGVGSSSSLEFRCVNSDVTRVTIFNQKEIEIPNALILEVIREGINSFLENYGSLISSSDPSYYDLQESREDFSKMFPS